jgi:hypothetical protein
MYSKLKIALVVLSALTILPVVSNAQTKPGLKKPASRSSVAPLVPVGTNLKVRLNETLSSEESRAGDKFTATAIDPVRLTKRRCTGIFVRL